MATLEVARDHAAIYRDVGPHQTDAYRITYSWSEKDILPSVASFDTAVDAHRGRLRLSGAGMKVLGVEVIGLDDCVKISQTRLADLARAEHGLPATKGKTRRLRKARKALASVALGIIASALPNSFRDFGVIAAPGGLRLARITRALKR